MDYKDSRKKEVRRTKKGVVITILVGVVLFGGLWAWALWPEPAQAVTFHKEIERLATERGIPVIEVEKLEVKFVEGVGFGGAGGLGAPIVTSRSPEQFVELCGKEGKIFVANERRGNEVIRKYWALVPHGNYVIEYIETYSSPGPILKVSGITPEGVVFEKAYLVLGIVAVVITVIAGPIYAVMCKEILYPE
jgi:hypothetical protein